MTIPAFTERRRVNQPDNGLRFAVYKRHAAKIGMPTADYIAHIDAGEKRCSACGEWKRARTDFSVGTSKCRECVG